jgi:transposase
MLWTQLHHSGAKPMPGAITTIDSSDHPLRIFAAIELSRTKWIVAIQVSGSDKASLIEVPSGDTAWLLGILEKARQKIAGQELRPVEILTCYEAGYDGFWLHRFLEARGIRNWIIDSASIQVSRRKRNVKTDRIDAGGLLRVLMARHRGEHRVCSVVVVPTPEEEDLKRLHRSRASLLRDRVRHVNRIKGLLNLQGISEVGLMRKDWLAGVSKMKTGDGRPFPRRLLAELRREARLLHLILDLLADVTKEIEALSRPRPAKAPRKACRYEEHPIATQLAKIVGIGPTFAAVFATEVFYRRFKNRREVASYLGLTPTPYASGGSSRDQGISKAGNPVARYHAIELAWLWLRNQPGSRLTRWFNDRVGDARGRVRRIAIVALARKLMIALWRYLETGLIPDGATMRV